MRILVLGGTNFIGRAIVDAAVTAGHDVLLVHRGTHEPDDPTEAEARARHLHADRATLADGPAHDEIAAFAPEAIVDCLCLTKASAESIRAALPFAGVRWVVLSSMDAYRAFSSLNHGRVTDLLPIDESSPPRDDRFPYPDQMPEYSKLDVEDVMLPAGAVVCRLPMVFGPHDYQRREESLLRRVRAGRSRIPIGPGGGLLPRGFVRDIARGVVSACETPGIEGELFNLCEGKVAPVIMWARQVLAAAGSDTQLVEVPDGTPLPPDLGLSGHIAQPVLVSSDKARRLLGYTDTPWEEAVAVTVAWHLAHPPAADESGDDLETWEADDAALAAADAALAAAADAG